MNKHGRVIEIKGIKGVITAIFVVCCLVTGFTVFPGYIAMQVWNLAVPYVTDMPQMNLLHGVMLWAILFLIWFAFNGKLCSFHFGYNNVLDEREIADIIERVKSEEKTKENTDNEE